MISKSHYFLMGLILTLTIGCATKNPTADEKLQVEIEKQPTRKMHGEVAQKGFESIIQSKTLTDSQKESLLKIHSKMSADTYKIQEETSQLKSVLFETIATDPYDRKKVRQLKKKLVSLNKQKMNNMFNAINEVQEIVGKKDPNNLRDFYRPFFWEQVHESPR